VIDRMRALLKRGIVEGGLSQKTNIAGAQAHSHRTQDHGLGGDHAIIFGRTGVWGWKTITKGALCKWTIPRFWPVPYAVVVNKQFSLGQFRE
jgi:hypothetical protein